MKAIVSRYVPATSLRGSRYMATDGDGGRVYVDSNSDLQIDDLHKLAVMKLCQKRDWKGILVQGYLMKGGHDQGRVWVWLDFGDHHNKAEVFSVGVDLDLAEAIAWAQAKAERISAV